MLGQEGNNGLKVTDAGKMLVRLRRATLLQASPQYLLPGPPPEALADWVRPLRAALRGGLGSGEDVDVTEVLCGPTVRRERSENGNWIKKIKKIELQIIYRKKT